jgi:hypothetical protein
MLRGVSQDSTRNNVRGWLAEGTLIVISVALGFYVSQCGENRADGRLKARALASLQAELEHNLAAVQPYVAFHQALANALEKADAAEKHESGFEVYLRVRRLPANFATDVPIVRRAAWDAASSSGALRLIDYDLLAGLAEVYQMQDHLGDAIGRIPTSTPAFFDPGVGNPSVHLAQAAVREMVFAEQALVELYKKQLDALRATADR